MQGIGRHWRAWLAALIGASAMLAGAQDFESSGQTESQTAISAEIVRQLAVDRVEPVLPAYDSPKLWFRQNVGHSSATELRRTRDHDDPERWARLFDGLRSGDKDYVFLWHPNGVTEGEGWMQFDWVAEGLVDVDARHICDWRDEARAWLDEESHRRLVIYIGAPGKGGTTEGEAFEQFVLDWILDTHPRIEIAFDAGASTAEDSPAHRWAKRLASRGVRVWVEALVPLEGNHWEGFGQVCIDKFYRRQLRTAGDVGFAHYTGEFNRKPPGVMRESVVFFTGHSRVPFAPVAGEPIDYARYDIARPWDLYGVLLGWMLTREGWSWGIEAWASDDYRELVALLPDAPYDGPVEFQPLDELPQLDGGGVEGGTLTPTRVEPAAGR